MIGGSKNTGYYAARRLLGDYICCLPSRLVVFLTRLILESGSTLTFLLRHPDVFDNDSVMKPFVSSGKAKLVHGDALKESDVKRAWDVASEGNTHVDLVLFTLGRCWQSSLL